MGDDFSNKKILIFFATLDPYKCNIYICQSPLQDFNACTCFTLENKKNVTYMYFGITTLIAKFVAFKHVSAQSHTS